jgi:hypothetical protein
MVGEDTQVLEAAPRVRAWTTVYNGKGETVQCRRGGEVYGKGLQWLAVRCARPQFDARACAGR